MENALYKCNTIGAIQSQTVQWYNWYCKNTMTEDYDTWKKHHQNSRKIEERVGLANIKCPGVQVCLIIFVSYFQIDSMTTDAKLSKKK